MIRKKGGWGDVGRILEIEGERSVLRKVRNMISDCPCVFKARPWAPRLSAFLRKFRGGRT